MVSTTKQNAVSRTAQPVCTFLDKQKIACKRASEYVAKWVKENNITCQELFFDRKLVSQEKDIFKYIIRAIDVYHRRAHVFELFCRKNKFEISFIRTSQSPLDLEPGELSILMSDVA